MPRLCPADKVKPSVSIVATIIVVLLAQNGSAMVYAQPSATDDVRRVVHWNLTTMLGGADARVSMIGAPSHESASFGSAVWFDGEGDAIIVAADPLKGLDRFTVEVYFRPDSGGLAAQRFLHMGEMVRDRIMIETRLNDRNRWYLDTFVRSGDSAAALIDSTLTHPVGEWYHAALVVGDEKMEAYVDGVLEGSTRLPVAPLKGGITSIGARQNKKYWFRGAIAWVRVTPEKLAPKHFTRTEGSN